MQPANCHECGSIRLNFQNGECHCKDCGLVVEDLLVDHSHYREGTSSTKPQLVDGKVFKGHWIFSSKEKNLHRARKKLKWLESKLSLPMYIKEQSYNIYKHAVDKDLCVGRDNYSILFACVYASCIQNEIPKTPYEIIEYSDVDKKHMLKAYKLLKKELGLKLNNYDPVDMLPRFINRLGLSQTCLNRAMVLLNKVKPLPIYSGKNPKSIVAAVIYIAAKLCKEKISQRDIANEMALMEVTIRRRYREISGEFHLKIRLIKSF